MGPNKSDHLTTIATEIAWLLGSWAIAFGLLGLVVGFGRLSEGPLDIQMHNRYFVLSVGYAVFPIFVFVATIVTVVRGVLGRFKQDSVKAVLGLLGIVWAFLLLLLFTLVKNLH